MVIMSRLSVRRLSSSAVRATANSLHYKIGRIISVSEHPNADSLYVSKVDVGGDECLTVCSGLRNHIAQNQLENRAVVVINNLKASKMRGVRSEAMVLAAELNDQVELVDPPASSKEGDLLVFKKLEDDFELGEFKKVSKKLQSYLQGLHTNEEREVVVGDEYLVNERNEKCGVASLANAEVR